MLSGLEIKKQVELGNIVISDFTEGRLNPNSYNIRLGNKLKVYKKSVASPDEVKAEIFKRMEPYHEEIQELMKMTGENALDEKLVEEKNKRVKELTKIQEDISNQVLRDYALDPKKENETIDITIPEEGYILMPDTLYLGETVEYTETYGYVPKIDGRSTTGRLGIVIHLTAGFGDNGFKGKWTLEITVTHPVIVYPNMEIGQLYFEELQGDSSMKYDGKYQNQKGVQSAKVDRLKLRKLCKNKDGFLLSTTDYDDKGNKIYYKYYDGYEIWFEYDEKGYVTYSKDYRGNVKTYQNKYDEKGNLIHTKNSVGFEEWFKYDENNNRIYTKDSNDNECWYDYDNKGNCIHSKDSNGDEEWHEYDENNNRIHTKDYFGDEIWYEYDNKGNCIHCKNSYGDEEWYEYIEYIRESL